MSRSPFFDRLRSIAGLATSTLALLQLVGLPVAGAFNISANTNLAVYWGQNSYGYAHPDDPSKWQRPLDYYCKDDTVDMFPIGFLINFNGTGGLPSINLANSCSGPYFPGTSLLDCTFMAPQIEACQDKGKAVTISLGGATGSPNLPDDEAGKAFAQLVWDLFLGGTSSTRPFGDAVLDGIDMDIEGGSQTGFVAFLTTLRSLMDASNKEYYITAAPQCVFPDHWIGTTLDHFGFDAVLVQFYNNWCGLENYDNSNAWNFGTWDSWAKNTSPNKNVKVYIGAPASSTAAGSGYVNATTLATILQETKKKYTSFGGAILWDMSQAYANGRYDVAVKEALKDTAHKDKPKITNAQTASGNCEDLSSWKSNVVYLDSDRVAYDGRLWSAKWWSYNDIPRGAVNVWTDEGACETSTPTSLKVQIEEAAQDFFDNLIHMGYAY